MASVLHGCIVAQFCCLASIVFFFAIVSVLVFFFFFFTTTLSVIVFGLSTLNRYGNLGLRFLSVIILTA